MRTGRTLGTSRPVVIQLSMLLSLLALTPLLIVFVGLVLFRRSGLLMGIVGWSLTVILATIVFRQPSTPVLDALYLSLSASFWGGLKSLGIALMALSTMLMLVYMKECGMLDSLVHAMMRLGDDQEERALMVAMCVGTALTGLGVATPALLPPFLLAMGFPPQGAVALSCLGYDATTSFALLSVPIVLPAQVSQRLAPSLGLAEAAIAPRDLAFQISLFLPIVAAGFALGMLWMVGGWNSIRRKLGQAAFSGLAIGLSTIAYSVFLPVEVVGIVAGMTGLASLLLWRLIFGKSLLGPRSHTGGVPLRKASFPWLFLILCVSIVALPPVNSFLANALGGFERVKIIGTEVEDLNILTNAYFWVFTSTVVSMIFVVRPKRSRVPSLLKGWLRKGWGPTVTYSIFFATSLVMWYSAGSLSAEGRLTVAVAAAEFNMNTVVATFLAGALGGLFFLVSPFLGLIGGIIGGSETSSNVMFFPIQMQITKSLSSSVGLTNPPFSRVFAAHAVAGGIASAVTPAKITNAAATIDRVGMEGQVIPRSMVISLILTLLTGFMLATAIFVFGS